MKSFVLKGTVLHAPSLGALEFYEKGYLVCQGGVCAGLYPVLPEKYAALPCTDYGDALILPGYADLHLHAAQYADLGLGMDMELLDWLDTLTFPEEARFADLSYGETVYSAFTSDLRRSFTASAAVFASVHTDSTLLLMEKLEQSGLRALVGKVNMDRNCPDFLRETNAAQSLAETRRWLTESAGRFRRTAPILTPRFVPSCTAELMAGLGKLAAEYHLPVQSHLSENPAEIQWVHELHPESESYAAVYDAYGLLGPKTLMAHCIYLSEGEMALLRRRGGFIAHCPNSNSNVRSGIAPVRRYLDAGVPLGLGSDISGGHTLDMSDVLREALQVSKLLWRLDESHPAPLKAPEAFYLATHGGGQYFGHCGAFLPGYSFDALVVDDSRLCARPRPFPERFERFIYLCTQQDITAKYVDGAQLF